jgi:glutamate synthase (NADPH) large chain
MHDWDRQIGRFVKVMPGDFRKALAGRGISLADQIRDKNVVYQDITVDVTQG